MARWGMVRAELPIICTQDHSLKYATVIPKFIKVVKTGGQPVVDGDGEQTIKYVTRRIRS